MNYYDALSISRDADKNEIKRAYFAAVKLHSPDSDPHGFRIIRSAYETLYDPKSRTEYDSYFVAESEINNEVLAARELMRQNKFMQALVFLNEAETRIPGAAEITRLKAEALWMLRKSGKAEDLCRALLEKNPVDRETLLLRAKIAESRGHTIKAEGYYNEAVIISPLDPKPWVMFMDYTIRNNRHMLSLVFQHAMSYSCDLFRDYYIYYLMSMRQSNSIYIFDDPLKYYDKFAEFFIHDENMDEETYRSTMSILAYVSEGEEYVPFLEKILPTIENSRYRSVKDEEDIKSLRANITVNKLKKDKRIHEILADITGYFVAEVDDKETLLGMECYIVLNMSDVRPSLRVLRKEYPDYFKLNQTFYLDVLNDKKTEFLTYKYFMTYKKLISDFDSALFGNDLSPFLDKFDIFDELDDEIDDEKPYVREAPKIGRNDPCPCGSGKKYKKCCG